MDITELPALFGGIKGRVSKAAFPAVMAMAQRFERYVVAELQLSRASPGQFGTPAPPGAPPAWRTGRLASSVTTTPDASGPVSVASVGPGVIYAHTQEYGGEHFPRRYRYMHWFNVGGPQTEWWAKHVKIPERPYMRPAHKATVADGSLHRAAMEAFIAATGL